MINLIEKIGKKGAFQLILDRITDTKNWASIDLVSLFSNIIAGLFMVYHREFAFSYIPKFKEAVWRNLLKSPESNIRNFTKDKIDSIVQAFEMILKRVYTIQEKQEVNIRYNTMI